MTSHKAQRNFVKFSHIKQFTETSVFLAHSQQMIIALPLDGAQIMQLNMMFLEEGGSGLLYVCAMCSYMLYLCG